MKTIAKRFLDFQKGNPEQHLAQNFVQNFIHPKFLNFNSNCKLLVSVDSLTSILDGGFFGTTSGFACGAFDFIGVDVNGILFLPAPSEGVGPLFRNSKSCSSVFFFTFGALTDLGIALVDGCELRPESENDEFNTF